MVGKSKKGFGRKNLQPQVVETRVGKKERVVVKNKGRNRKCTSKTEGRERDTGFREVLVRVP